MCWVMLQGVEEHLGLQGAVANASVRYAVNQGWLDVEGDPPRSVRLTHAGRRMETIPQGVHVLFAVLTRPRGTAGLR